MSAFVETTNVSGTKLAITTMQTLETQSCNKTINQTY